MGKYEPLASHLAAAQDDKWIARFSEIEAVLGFPLPRSARTYREWWSNQKGGGHSQAKGWQDAGWQVDRVDIAAEEVTFKRKLHRSGISPEVEVMSDLYRRAAELTGINDRDALIHEALRTLIAREAGERLIRLGGSMPDIHVPPRERPLP